MKIKKLLYVVIFSWFIGIFTAASAQELCTKCLKDVPKDMRDYVYNMDFMDKDQPLGPTVMKGWKSPRKPPWTIGYASTYAGNTWRKGAMERLMEVVYPKWKALGMVDEIVITQSNLDDTLQIQQMRQMIDGGKVDAIIICCSNLTALNQTIKYGWEKGIPTLSFTGATYFCDSEKCIEVMPALEEGVEEVSEGTKKSKKSKIPKKEKKSKIPKMKKTTE